MWSPPQILGSRPRRVWNEFSRSLSPKSEYSASTCKNRITQAHRCSLRTREAPLSCSLCHATQLGLDSFKHVKPREHKKAISELLNGSKKKHTIMSELTINSLAAPPVRHGSQVCWGPHGLHKQKRENGETQSSSENVIKHTCCHQSHLSAFLIREVRPKVSPVLWQVEGSPASSAGSLGCGSASCYWVNHQPSRHKQFHWQCCYIHPN